MPSTFQYSYKSFGHTDQGLMRSDNEDSFFLNDEHQIYAVADGLGGLPQGALASQLAVEMIEKHLAGKAVDAKVDFLEMFNQVNHAVFTKGREVSEDLGIGTTLTVAKLEGDSIQIGHVGDTGIVVFKQDSWKQLTRDHTMAQDMLDRLKPGEHAYIPEYFSHTLTRCIGQLSTIETDLYEFAIEPGDRIIIFSDGVTKTVDLDELHTRIFETESPEAFIKDLIAVGNERGGPDNITAVAIFVDS